MQCWQLGLLAIMGFSAMEESLKELRLTFGSGKTRSLEWRKSQLKALLNLIKEHESDIFAALAKDLGKEPVEAYRDEVGVIKKSLNLCLDCLHKWMEPQKASVPLLVFPSSAQIVPEPLGLVLVFSSWNYPLVLTLDPLIGAISAGNVVVLKPSEFSPATSSLIAELVPKYMDNRAVKVIEGGVAICEQLLEKKWDKIFFTGSSRIARVVLTAAARHLTPVTLELGGKCPAIVDYRSLSNRGQKVSLMRLVDGKWGVCNGQACIAVDYLLVQEDLASTLVFEMKKRMQIIYGNNPKESKAISRIVNKQHFERLKKLLAVPEVSNSIIHGGTIDEEDCYIEPTILLNPPLDSEIMNEEIFGPLLPIITLKHIEDSIEFINSKPKPLTLYAFTQDEELKRRIVSETSSGSVLFNDTAIQFLLDTIPFGGVGESGFGRYHGKYSFDTFSNMKGVLRRSFLTEFNFRYPPWDATKLKFIRSAYAFDYLDLILLILGLKK